MGERRVVEILPCDIPTELPILPLASTVVFPSTVVSLQVVREKNLNLIRKLAVDDIIGIVVQKESTVDIPPPSELTEMGVAARLANRINLTPTTVQLILIGIIRFRVDAYLQTHPFLRARVSCLEIHEPDDASSTQLVQESVRKLETLVEVDPRVPEETLNLIRNNLQGPGHLADQLSEYLNFQVRQKIEILQCVNPLERLQIANGIMSRQIAFGQVAREIQEETHDEINRSQREFILREQLKTIRKELGEESAQEYRVNQFRRRLEQKKLPPTACAEAEKEIGRLEILSPASPECGVVLTYLEWIFDLPWNQSTKDTLNIQRARKILNQNHYGLANVKNRIIEFLSVRELCGERQKGPILCLYGPPGTGKSSLGRSIAEALGRKFIRMSVGGMRDEAEVRGHRRTYVGALPGKILQGLRRVGSNNPLFIIDEIDKLGRDFRGDPASALLEVLDPEQNSSFTDLYLDLPFDLSRVMFVTTANQLDTIPEALLDRMEPIQLPGYTPEQKLEISRRFLLPNQLEAAGLDSKDMVITKQALLDIICKYTRDAGLRRLERRLAALCRSVAREIVERGRADRPKRINPQALAHLLGPPTYFPETAEIADEIGIATALAWTPAGGEILFIEATRMKGHGGLNLTGQIGEVMRESAQAALSYIRARAEQFKIAEADFERWDIHVHVPAGAIPKDGPSAGLAIAAALVSLMTGRPVRHTVALTGEITLRGRVLPIGGIQEKAMAAGRAGIGRVIFPRMNEMELVDLPPSLRKQLELKPVRRVSEALKLALAPRSRKETLDLPPTGPSPVPPQGRKTHAARRTHRQPTAAARGRQD